MKIKVIPEDFVVEELINLPFAKNGQYTILELKKKFWNTLDAIDLIARKLGVSKNRFSRAGLKDRYSLSTQYLSFRGAISKKITEKNFTVTPIGRAAEPITPARLTANKFTIVLRDLREHEPRKIAKNCAFVKEWGVPNYFDEQRFGSARHHQGFFAKKLIQEHYKGALKLILCYPYKEDGPMHKRFKKCCHDSWGAWGSCAEKAPREYAKIIDHLLSHPKDFQGAIKCIDRELLNLYLLAYQSYVFNRALYLVIREHGIDTREEPYSAGAFMFHARLKDIDALRRIEMPMVNEKTRLSGYAGDKIREVLEEEGLVLKQFGLGKMRFRGVRFKPFLRKALVFPADLNVGPEEPDERYPGKKKIRVEFSLPPGSYATILIKRLIAETGSTSL